MGHRGSRGPSSLSLSLSLSFSSPGDRAFSVRMRRTRRGNGGYRSGRFWSCRKSSSRESVAHGHHPIISRRKNVLFLGREERREGEGTGSMRVYVPEKRGISGKLETSREMALENGEGKGYFFENFSTNWSMVCDRIGKFITEINDVKSNRRGLSLFDSSFKNTLGEGWIIFWKFLYLICKLRNLSNRRGLRKYHSFDSSFKNTLERKKRVEWFFENFHMNLICELTNL